MKKAMKDGNHFAFLSHDLDDPEHSKQVQLPGVTVVMPLKGFGEHNLHNWRTQVLELFEKTNICLGVVHVICKLYNEPGVIFCALLPFLGICLMAIIHLMAALRFHFKDNLTEEPLLNPNGLRLVGGLVICTAIELLSMWNFTRIEVRLCNMLSPEAPPLSLGAYNWSLVFVAMVVDNFLYPISAIRSHFSQSINWSGIRYHLRNGKIHKIDRTMEKGKKFSDLAAKRLYARKGAQSKISILGSFSRSLAQWRQPKKFDV